MIFPTSLFRQAGLNTTDIAAIFGVSRVTAARWLSGVSRRGTPGVGVNVFLVDRVTKGARQVEAAIAAGELPDATLSKMPPTKRCQRIKAMLNKQRTK